MSTLASPPLSHFKWPSFAFALWPRGPGQPASLAQCATLALLLHLLLVVIFGNAPGGTAKPGEGIWGVLNVTLRALEPGTQEPGNVAPDVDTGPTGDALRRRWGGAVRSPEVAPALPSTPGAATVGTWSASPAAPEPPQPASPPAQRESTTPAIGSPVVPQARIGFTAPPGPPQLTAPPAAPLLAPKPTAEPGAPVELPPREALLPSVAAVERPSTPNLERDSAAPTVTRPLVAPPVPLTPIERLAAPAPLPAPESAAETPASRTLPVESVRNVDVVAPLAPLAPLAPSPKGEAVAAPTTPALQRVERIDSAPSLPTLLPALEAGRTAPGTPDAGARAGRDVATAPSATASAPRLNLELAKPRGGAISTQGSRGLLLVLPTPPERKNKLADDIEKSAKKDCRDAYSGWGLLAVIPLAANAAKGEGCKW